MPSAYKMSVVVFHGLFKLLRMPSREGGKYSCSNALQSTEKIFLDALQICEKICLVSFRDERKYIDILPSREKVVRMYIEMFCRIERKYI